ncbi:uncharacterized protein LOC113676808 [Pocillopora damicornis]|uniref:uncharacterized protein LOC113676808 n=1 Tax=Pocillopora damicornis TaxID=46731 RepID=UPI000F553367|nr:uncharacterized protein LOC113676808 [Pocillopora damicornis]
MKRSGLETTVKETEVDQDHFKVIRFYREKMNQQPLHSALRSFNIQDGVRMSGVYEIHRNNEIIYIGGNPYFSNIRDCLNAHFSGNDGLPIGRYLSGPGKRRWRNIAVRWLTCLNPPEIVYFLLEDYQLRNGALPIYNNAPNVQSRDWDCD